MNKTLIVGYNFLHSHPLKERSLNLEKRHCIIDRDELLIIIEFFNENPELATRLNEFVNIKTIENPT